MKHSALKPCPFCHGTRWQYVSRDFGVDYESVAITCVICGLTGPASCGEGDQRPRAMERWNQLPRNEEKSHENV